MKRWNASNAMEDCADSNRTATFISGCEKYVLASDYDSLLSVLRRCVEPMEVSLEWLDGKQGTGMICELLRQTLSAARAVLEESAEARKEGKR